jgi:uncharacterized protein
MLAEAAIASILFLSGFTMSFAGFGFALVSVPLLALFMPVHDAVALQFPYSFGLCAYQAWHYRRHFSWADMRGMVPGAALGVGVGATLLHLLPALLLKRGLALLIALAVLFNLTPLGDRLKRRYALNPWWGHWCGLLSGAFFGAYTIGGPAAVLYILSVQKDTLRVKSFLATLFSIQFLIITVIYSLSGMLHWQGIKTSGIFAPAVAAGSVAGFLAFRRASPLVYFKVVDLVLLGASAALWWQA